MIALALGDAHITGKNPVARVDNLVELQFTKWEEIVSIANDYDCPIISVGDIFNVPIVANSILTIFGDIISNLNHPLYFVWGNHDLMYHSLDICNRTSLGMLLHNNFNIKHVSQFENDYNFKWDYQDWNQPIVKTGGSFLLTHQAIINPKLVGGNNSWILKDTEFSKNIMEDKELQEYDMIFFHE